MSICPSIRPPVCLSVRKIKVEKRWTYFDEIWYGRYAIGGYPKIVLPTIGNTNMADARTYEVGATLPPLNIGSYNDAW
jgi:hypothetical protein